jgi:hypothetical protein
MVREVNKKISTGVSSNCFSYDFQVLSCCMYVCVPCMKNQLEGSYSFDIFCQMVSSRQIALILQFLNQQV